MEGISVFLCDDHKVVTESLRELLEKEKGINITGIVHSIAACREMLERGQPDVLLLDVSFPNGGSGIDFCPEIRKHFPDVKILMLTSYAESNVIARAFDKGAHGYVLKNSASEELIEGIRTVAAGRRFLCDETDVLFRQHTYQPVTISPKEYEVMKLIVGGFTLKEISDKLCLGFETVKSYHRYLHLKLDVRNTAQLVRKAIEEKLV